MLSSHQASHRATCWHAPCQAVHSRSTAAVSPQCSCGQGRRLVQCAVNAGTLESAALALAAGTATGTLFGIFTRFKDERKWRAEQGLLQDAKTAAEQQLANLQPDQAKDKKSEESK